MVRRCDIAEAAPTSPRSRLSSLERMRRRGELLRWCGGEAVATTSLLLLLMLLPKGTLPTGLSADGRTRARTDSGRPGVPTRSSEGGLRWPVSTNESSDRGLAAVASPSSARNACECPSVLEKRGSLRVAAAWRGSRWPLVGVVEVVEGAEADGSLACASPSSVLAEVAGGGDAGTEGIGSGAPAPSIDALWESDGGVRGRGRGQCLDGG